MNLPEIYRKIRNYSAEQVSYLKTEDFVSQPVEFVSPPKWNLAHTTWFFEEFVLKPGIKNYKVFNKNYSFLFNSYYVNVGERTIRGHRGSMTRPSVSEIMEYRSYVDKAMVKLLENENVDKELAEVITLGLNHEQQHQELFLTDIKYIFGFQPLFPKYNDFSICESGKAGRAKWIDIQEGIYEIGHQGREFHYDNELNRHKVYLHQYHIADSLVSNSEYHSFINDGGYSNHNLWHSDGFTWLEKENVKSPLYWHFLDGEWYQYTLAGLKKLQPEAPVTHISYYEAFAYAQWKKCRLPTEFEWEAASDHFQWGDRWEWTESAYLPYPGYQRPEGAIGEYNGKFMVNQKVLRGASLATSPGHSRKTYRNFFQPEFSWQFTGIRLVK